MADILIFGMKITRNLRTKKNTISGTGGLTMPRYIDAEAMIRKICGMKCGCERYECGYDEAGCPKVRDLETAPTVSPDEVRGVGEWIQVIEEDGTCSKCSCCGEGYYIRFLPPFYYCPHCGAKMEVSDDA